MLIVIADNSLTPLIPALRAAAMFSLIAFGFIVVIAILFATVWRLMKQLNNDPLCLFQHKLIKWLYMVCLAVGGIIGLVIIVAGGLSLAELLQGDNQQLPIPVQISLGIAFLIGTLCMLIMTWVLPACDKLLSKFKKG